MNQMKGLVSCTVAFLALASTGAVSADTVTVDPLGGPVAPGSTVTFTGDITNSSGFDEPLDSVTYTLLTGPAGADLSSAAVFDTYFGPDPLSADGYTGDLFSLDIDPNAPDGLYTANLDVEYGEIPSDPNTNFSFTVASATSVTPEPSPTVALAIGLAGLGLLAYKCRRKSMGTL